MTDFPALGEFARYLESEGELTRVRVEVDPKLEMTAIAVRALKERKPALLFEKVKGSDIPVVMNLFASDRRIELALGRHPEQIGSELVGFFERIMPPSAKLLWKERKTLTRFARSRARRVGSGSSQEVSAEVNLARLPVQVCWPADAGRFITMGQVMTQDPVDAKRNVGIYRLQLYDERTTGMHWQIQKGGGFHYYRAERLGRDLEVAVVLGSDPALLLASVAALPEEIDEVQFASFLRGKPFPLVKAKTISMDVPANAEFILEGVVPPRERRMEGPFGDHFGHYSAAAPFPVFHVRHIAQRRNPVYPAIVVGRPPMEDKFLGDASQKILGPLARLIHKEVRDLWAYSEAGFHNLLVVAVEERYKKEALKAALGLLGTGQLSLTKTLILVSEEVPVADWRSVLRAVRESFDPRYDFLLLPNVALDTLDFTSYKMELGSKMIIDATTKDRPRPHRVTRNLPALVRRIDRSIVDAELEEDCLLKVKVRGKGRDILERLVRHRDVRFIPVVACVSEDVNIRDREDSIWGIFTRFDCQRDVTFTEKKLVGASPLYGGAMGIDATWKRGYPDPLVMKDSIVRKVENRWEQYWR
ncbi:MAG TPA: menaquinone biosynthesis decarboxylase [Bacteroidota bacterium]|nr:menaquinone biosynthesis decarboxylase [Bacteroidota bacterium]